MSAAYQGPHGTPLYWRYETSGVLAAAVTAYLNNRIDVQPITAEQVSLLRDYIVQWINAPCWDNSEFAPEMRRLRSAAEKLNSAAQIERWTRQALNIGIDPL